MRRLVLLSVALLAAACHMASRKDPADSKVVRIGFLTNVTHAQALVGRADGTFAKAVGQGVKLMPFNAGPAAMEALLGGSIDMAYVGGIPAIIAHVRSEGHVQVVAGAASGGAVLVVRSAQKPEDLIGKLVATPQLGNTQDVSLRYWLAEQGLHAADLGEAGVQVVPLTNADALGQFRRGSIEGAWVPEPWGARMILEGGGRILIDERELWPDGRFPTTVLVASDKMIRERPEQLAAVLKAHQELTTRWQSQPQAFAEKANQSLAELTHHPLPPAVLSDAFSRIEPTVDTMEHGLTQMAERAERLGYLPSSRVAQLIAPEVPPP